MAFDGKGRRAIRVGRLLVCHKAEYILGNGAHGDGIGIRNDVPRGVGGGNQVNVIVYRIVCSARGENPSLAVVDVERLLLVMDAEREIQLLECRVGIALQRRLRFLVEARLRQVHIRHEQIAVYRIAVLDETSHGVQHASHDKGHVDERAAAGAAADARHDVHIQERPRHAGPRGVVGQLFGGILNGPFHQIVILHQYQASKLANASRAGIVVAGRKALIHPFEVLRVGGMRCVDLRQREYRRQSLRPQQHALVGFQSGAACALAGFQLVERPLVRVKGQVSHVLIRTLAGQVDEALGLDQRLQARAAEADHQVKAVAVDFHAALAQAQLSLASCHVQLLFDLRSRIHAIPSRYYYSFFT